MYRAHSDLHPSSPAQAHLQQEVPTQGTAIVLTAREKEVLQWSAAGKSSWEIARILSCTESGVNYHFGNIRRKFGVRSRWIALVIALEKGLIQTP